MSLVWYYPWRSGLVLGYPSLGMEIHDILTGTRGKKRGLTCATVLRFSRGENYGALITLAAGGRAPRDAA